ncbi:carbohydrate ABC transporter permease [Paenibacillus thalictri]|uniref:Sugar ABC transporter permease n=1 Tax=Paenibacillus thalictri TaxID=2527873 RepID=A0A4V2J2Z9_9BACL|nr:sugar ABC transporter permease [Paenibacillus thalictri]TBL68488.1 sugar ABC transporter permease [Paenibacillus thalictri]
MAMSSAVPNVNERKKKAYHLERTDTVWGYIYLSPVLLWVLIFMLFPMFYMVYLSFFEWNFISPVKKYIGLGNYIQLFQDDEFLESVLHTIHFTVASVILTVVCALLIALALNRTFRGVGILRSVYYSPVVVSMVAAAMVWSSLFDPNFGAINRFLKLFGIQGPGWISDPDWALWSIIIMSVWKMMGYYAVIYLAALQGIPESLYEASSLDGAGRWRTFTSITWPMLLPATLLIGVMGVINSFQVFGQVYIMTQGGPVGRTNVIVNYLYEKAFHFFEMGYASAIGFVLFAMIFIVTLIQFKFVNRKLDY